MATSGSVVTSSCEGRSVTLNWSVTSQSVANNTSTISWKLIGSGSYTGWVKCGGFYVSIGGNVVCNWSTDTRIQVQPNTAIANGTLTLSHNADGSKSFSVNVQAGIYEYTRNRSGSGTFSLDKIARTSQVSISGGATMGTTMTIKTNRAVGSGFTHTITRYFGTEAATIAENVTDSCTWNVPVEELAPQMIYSTSGGGTIGCHTYSGSTWIGASSVYFTTSIPENIVPEVTSVTVTPDNSANDVVKGWGLWVSGYTKAHITAEANGIYGSIINSFSINGRISGNASGSTLDYTSDAITISGNTKFTVTATDTRGRISAAKTSSEVTIYPYSAPIVTNFMVHRSDSTTTQVIVNADWNYASVNSKNAAAATLQYKQANATDWITYGTISKNTDVTLSNTFSESSRYNFRLTVTDSVGNSASMDSSITTTEALMDFRTGGKGLAVGKMAESDAFEVGLDAKFYAGVYVGDITLKEYIKSYMLDAFYPVGSIKMTTTSTNPGTYLGGTWEAWGGGRVPVGVDSSDADFSAAEKTGGEKTHTLTVTEMPSHHHNLAYFPSYYTGTAWVGASGTSKNRTDMYTNYTGGSQAHNNLQPYITCYMWKRTA